MDVWLGLTDGQTFRLWKIELLSSWEVWVEQVTLIMISFISWLWYDMHVVKFEYHALFHIVFFHIVFWTFFLYLSVLKNTNSRHTVQPAIPNTVLTDYIIPSKKSSPLVCQERLFIATNMFSEYFDQLQHISKVFSSMGKKPSHFIFQFVHFLLHYLSLSELSWQGRVKLAHSYGWDNPVFFGCWITPDYSVINLARAKPSWSRSDFHQQGVGNFGYNKLITLKKHVVAVGQAWS